MRNIARLIIDMLKPYWKTILWCSGLAILAALLNMIGPIALGRATDSAKGATAPLIVAAGIAAWLIISHAAERIQQHLAWRGAIISYTVASAYKLGAVATLLRKPLSFHYGQRSGDMTEKLSMFENEIENVIQGVVFDLIPALLTVAAMLAYLAVLDWRVSLLLGLTVFGVVYNKYRCMPTGLNYQKAWRAASRDVSSTAWDAIRNVLIVKSTTAEGLIDTRLVDKRAKLLETINGDVRFDQQMSNRENLIIRIGSALVLMVALLNVRSGAFSFGQFTAVSAYTFGIFGYVRYVQWQLRSSIRAAATQEEMDKLLKAAPEDFESGRPVELHGGLEFRDVRYRYRPDVPVLEDVSFTVRPGERVAVVGESGEGKTTLVDLIGRYHLPQEGSILYDGVDAEEVNLKSLREQIGLVPQDLPLLHESIGENIRFGRREATDEEMRLAAKQASLHDFIEGLPDGYATVVGERGLKLSGGQRQRMALARAFLRNPKILILDEPTSNLDSKTEEEIQRSLETLMKGRTTFIIAHRLRTVRDADRILVLKGGRIVEQGRHDELIVGKGAYAELLRAQTGTLAPNETHLGDEAAA